MRKTAAAATVVLVFLAASFLAVATPVFGATAAANSWVPKASMNAARGYLGVAVVNGKIYAIGGDQGSLIGNAMNALGMTQQTTNATEEYAPSLDKWILKSPMPTARARLGTAVYQNKIYCIGGYSATIVGETKYFDLGVNEVYNPATDTWESKAPLPTPRHSPATNMVDGKIYVIGGYSITTHSVLNVAEVYDPLSDTWATKTPPPLEVGSSASAVVDNRIYVLGLDSNAWRTLIQIYDPATDNWSLKASSPVSSFASAAATTGLNAPIRIYFFDENRTDVYDPVNDSWVAGTPAPTPRPVASAAVIDDLIYVVGGRTGQWGYMTFMYPSALVEQYAPIGSGAPEPYVPPVDSTPPEIKVLSSANQTYNQSSVSFDFTVDKPLNWTGYSLDSKENVTVTGNFTLTDLSNGLHTLTVYANDTLGNMGVSETIDFAVAVPEPEPEPFPVVPVAAVAVVAVAAAAGLLVYFKKRKQ
jgi:N-acetylneuraminic acid mutarotase